MDKKNIVVVAGILVLAAIGVWYWQNKRAALPGEEVATPAESLGAELIEKTQNPLKDELPSTNPFKEAETNPFIDAYKNPF